MPCCSEWAVNTFEPDAMDFATQTHLSSLREQLEVRLAELRAEVHAAEQAAREAEPLLSREVGDSKDEAARRSAGEVSAAEEQRDMAELAYVEAALRRLQAGRYGDCVDCGEPIPFTRLQVQPAAQRCAACQSAYEHALTLRRRG
jgi:RNA polymerase-binding protein DksA